MVPWITEADQKVLFKDNVTFESPEDQVKTALGRKYFRFAGVNDTNQVAQIHTTKIALPAQILQFHSSAVMCLVRSPAALRMCESGNDVSPAVLWCPMDGVEQLACLRQQWTPPAACQFTTAVVLSSVARSDSASVIFPCCRWRTCSSG